MKVDDRGQQELSWNKQRQTAAMYFEYMWSNHRSFFCYALIMAMSAPLIGIACQWILRHLIDSLFVAGTHGSPAVWLCVLIGSWILRDGLGVWRTMFEGRGSFVVARDLELALAQKKGTLDLGAITDKGNRDLLFRFKEMGPWRVTEYHGRLLNFVGCVLQLAACIWLVLISVTDYALLLLATAGGVIAMICEVAAGEAVWQVYSARMDLRRWFWNIMDHLRFRAEDIAEIKLNGTAPFFVGQLKLLFRRFEADDLKKSRKHVVYRGVGMFAVLAASAAAVLRLSAAAQEARITPGQFFLIFSLVSTYMAAFVQIGVVVAGMVKNGFLARENFEMLKMQRKLPLPPPEQCKRLPGDAVPQLELRNIWFRYDYKQPWLFQGLNLTIKAGEKVAFVGENGAGKTTLLNLILRFFDPASDGDHFGQILLGGIDIRELDEEQRLSLFAYLPQHPSRYDFRVSTVIRMGNIKRRFSSLRDWIRTLRSAGDAALLNEVVSRYSTQLGESYGGIKLSGGGEQRLGIARMLFRNAAITILDEPTSAQDPLAEKRIVDNIKDYTQGRTLMLVLHRLGNAREMDRIIVLRAGQIIEDGTHDELMSADGYYAEMFTTQAKSYQCDTGR